MEMRFGYTNYQVLQENLEQVYSMRGLPMPIWQEHMNPIASEYIGDFRE
jgi:hypothetical protein